MLISANLTVFEAVSAGVMLFLLGVALVQWIRYRAGSYHAATGYWAVVAMGFGFMAVASIARGVSSQDDAAALYMATALWLVGFVCLLTALLRLIAWNTKRISSS